MRPPSDAGQDVEDLGVHAQLIESNGATSSIQQSQHHTLAMHCRHCRDSQIKLARRGHSDAPILRAPAFHMSSSASSLIRDTMACCSAGGASGAALSTPSRRKRVVSPSRVASR